jgi:pre-mRNA-splicing factor 38B
MRAYLIFADEIYSTVRHLAPWQTGTTRAPSSAFCLLLKLLVMGVTHNQVHGLLATDDCPYVRGMGLLMLRYICAPKDLYGYFEPYLEDDSVFSPSHDEAEQMTMGAYAIKLLTDMQYFGTTLPRIPVPIERKIKVLLLLLKEKQTRRVEQFMKYYDGPHLEKGAAVQAIYSDEENEPAWYAGVIQRKASLDEVNDHNKRLVNIDSAISYPIHYYWVHFPEYGNTELVDLGDMKVSGDSKESHGKSSRSRSASRGGAKRHRRDDRSSSRGRDHRDRDRSRRRSRSRSRTRSRSRDRSGRGGGEAATRDLMAEVLKNEREASEAVGRNYAHRPASYKGSLSLKQERYTVRKKSRSRSPLPRSSQAGRGTSSSSSAPPASADISQQASMAASREYQEKMKKLIDRYGDASAK